MFSKVRALSEAAYSGHLHVVQWLVEHSAVLTSCTLTAAVSSGNSKLCKYLMERGCEWTAAVTDTCIHRCPELIPWVLSQGVCLTVEQQVRCDQDLACKRDQQQQHLAVMTA
jgi:hypothetical protein